jgi:hypothetical protein
VARALGHAYWRHLFMQAHPNLDRKEMREELRKSWGGSRREFARLGRAVLRQLEGMGYAVRMERESDIDAEV